MGWGTSAKRAASPQPVRAAPKVIKSRFKPLDPVGIRGDEFIDDDKESLLQIEDVPPSKEHLAEMEWVKERSRWASDTANMIVTDFVRSKALFSELVKFSRKRRR